MLRRAFTRPAWQRRRRRLICPLSPSYPLLLPSSALLLLPSFCLLHRSPLFTLNSSSSPLGFILFPSVSFFLPSLYSSFLSSSPRPGLHLPVFCPSSLPPFFCLFPTSFRLLQALPPSFRPSSRRLSQSGDKNACSGSPSLNKSPWAPCIISHL